MIKIEERRKYLEDFKEKLEKQIESIKEQSETMPDSMRKTEFNFAYVSGREAGYQDVINYIDNEIETLQNQFKEQLTYKSEKELYQMICDFNRYNAISGAEKAVFNALSKVNSSLRWDLYKALYKFIDGFLFNIES